MMRCRFALLARSLALATPMLLSLSQTGRAADPQPYAVDLAKTGNAELDGALNDSSDLITLRETSPIGPFALIIRARGDIDRLNTALKAYGYYKGKITIKIAGHELDDPSLPGLLQDGPADPPAKVEVGITTGPVFHLRRITIQGGIPAQARSALTLAPGQPALAAQVLAGQGQLLAALRENGYALAKVQAPVAYEHAEDDALDIVIDTTPGPRVDVGPIGLDGLKKVNESYIRRRLLLKTGQLYQTSAIDKAREDLSATGVFSSVQVTTVDKVQNGQVPVDFTFLERSRHTVGFTGAYSTDLGASTAVTWSHRNLFGNAEQLNLKAAVINIGGSSTMGIGYDVDAQFVKPDFLRRAQSLTANLEAIKQSFEAYEQTALIASAIVNRIIDRNWVVGGGVQAEQEKITQEGATRDYTLASLPMNVKYDSTNDLFEPTQGIRAALVGTPTASMGGKTQFFATVQLSGSTYIDFSDNGHSILALRAIAATVQGATAMQLPPDQRLYAGGSPTIRGYKFQSVGPQFPDNNPVGGTQLAAATIEFRQRVWGDIGMAAFMDAGEVTGTRGRDQYGTAGPDTSGRLAVGAGVGARYFTPIGPIRLDVAVPLRQYPGTGSFQLYIGLGEAF